MSTRQHFHHSLKPYPNNYIHIRRMDGRGKIYNLVERVNPFGVIEILKQHGNRYVPIINMGGARQHVQNTTTLMHAKGIGKGKSSEHILKEIYSGFNKANNRGIRKL